MSRFLPVSCYFFSLSLLKFSSLQQSFVRRSLGGAITICRVKLWPCPSRNLSCCHRGWTGANKGGICIPASPTSASPSRSQHWKGVTGKCPWEMSPLMSSCGTAASACSFHPKLFSASVSPVPVTSFGLSSKNRQLPAVRREN